MNDIPEKLWEMIAFEQEQLHKEGWVAHFKYGTPEEQLNGLADVHTHGLSSSFGHKDLQVVLPLEPKLIYSIFSNIVSDIKEGAIYRSNIRNPKVLNGYDVVLKEFDDNDRTVLRVILPDPNGLFPDEKGCIHPYNKQYEELPSY